MLLCNINPFMVTASILSLGVEIKKMFPLTQMRIGKYEDKLRELVAGLLDNCYEPVLIEKLLNQKDIDGYSPLFVLAQHKFYSIMKTDIANQIIMNKWNSKVDACGSLLENSIPYKILKFEKIDYKVDLEEKRMRFYHKRDVYLDVRPHVWTFRVWFQSMNMRYKIEMVFFILCTLAFQFYIGLFVSEFNDTGCTINQLNLLSPKEILQQNPDFCPQVDQSSDSRVLTDYDLSCCIKLKDNLVSNIEIPE